MNRLLGRVAAALLGAANFEVVKMMVSNVQRSRARTDGGTSNLAEEICMNINNVVFAV